MVGRGRRKYGERMKNGERYFKGWKSREWKRIVDYEKREEGEYL